MEKRILFLLGILQAVVFCQVQSFEFVYNETSEDKPEIVRFDVSLNGSYASLGEWPHWCLGNISKCYGGIAIDLWVKFANVSEDTPGLIVFSNGGHSWHSNGVYLLQKYGNEYQLGVGHNDATWTVNFKVIPNLWVNIRASWDLNFGLTVLVDGASYENHEPSERDYQRLEFDTFLEAAIGLNLDGSSHTEDERFEIARLTISDLSVPLMRSELISEDLLWLGCGSPTVESSSQMSLSDCRATCASMGLALSAIQNDELCSCAGLESLGSLETNRTNCQGSTVWHFYVASALMQSDTKYWIKVTTQKLGTKDYVLPLESISIHIETNALVDVPFTVDFGDGTFLETTERDVSYFWLTAGSYDITVTAEIGITVVTGTTTFNIEDVDEGYEGDFVMVNAFHGEHSYLGNIDFISIDLETRACDVSFGENSPDLNLRGLSGYVVNEYLTNTFPNFGQYNLTVVCMNNYGFMKNHSLFESRKMETSYHYHEVGTEFSTVMAGTRNFFTDLSITHNDPNISVPILVNDSWLVVKPEYLRLHENLIEYRYEDTIIDSRILSVQNILGKPQVNSSLVDGAWNLTTNITVRVPQGNNIFLNVSFSVGEDQTFYIHHILYQSEIVFEVMFPTLGYYDVLVNISNDISHATANMLVSVEVPIRTIELRTADITDKETQPVSLYIDLNEGIRGPMKVNFDIDYGNGLSKTYYHYSSTYFFSTYIHEYFYPDWGNYDICVRAYNRISSVTKCIAVQVGQKITYTDIQTPSDARFEVNETVVYTIRAPKGSDKTYVVDFGDGETFVFTDRYLTELGYLQESSTIDPWKRTQAMSTNATSKSHGTTAIPNSDMYTVNGTDPSGNGTTIVPTQSDSNNTLDSATTATSETTAGVESSTEASQTTESVLRRRKRNVNETSASLTQDEIVKPNTGNISSDSEMSGMAASGNSSDDNGDIDDTASWNNHTMGNVTGGEMYNTTIEETTSNNNMSMNESGIESTQETTMSPVITTTMVTTTTTEPIPDDATNPFTSNTSTAVQRQDRTVIVTHRYQTVGVYTVRLKIANHFNWARDTLCPSVIVTDKVNDSCKTPELNVNSKFQSSRWNPLQFFRSDQINLTAAVTLDGCGAEVPTYSWRTFEIIEENGRKIERQFHGEDDICVLESTEKIFRYRRSSLPFGFYKVQLTVSPSAHPLQTVMHDFYMMVNPSAPYAIIEGNEEHLWFLVYGTTMIKFADSVDPDFNTRDGIHYDLVCMSESTMYDVSSESRDTLISQSNLVTEGKTYKYTSRNPVRIYEYETCFEQNDNLTEGIRFPRGEFHVPSSYFVSSVRSFGIRLFVTKNNLTTSASVTFEIRLSNASDLLDQLDDLLASKDTTGVMRAVEALSATLITTPSNGSEEEDFEAKEEMSKLKDKLIGALDSVSTGVKDLGQAAGMLDLVDGLTKDSTSVSDSARAGATSAIKNSANVAEEFADEPLDSLTDVGSKVVSGVSNVLPKEDETAAKLAEHEKALAAAEKDAEATLGTEKDEESSEEDGADITLEDDTGELTELTEEDMETSAPLPYNKLLKKCDLLHSSQLDKLYKYIFFYESIFRQEIKNKSELIMISADILKLPKNDMFCYIGILEEPADVEWYYNRYFDEEKRRRDLIRRNADRDVSNSFLGAIDSVSSVLLNKTEANQTVELNAPGLKVAMKKANPNDTSEEDDSQAMMGGGVKMPSSVLSESGNDTEVGQTMIVNENSPFTYANENDTTEIGTGVVTFKLSTPGTKDAVSVSNTSEPIQIWLAGKPELMQPPKLHQLQLKTGTRESVLNTHRLDVGKNDTTIHVIVRPQDPDSSDLFDVLIQYEEHPNDTHYLEMATLPYPEEYFSGNLTWEHRDLLRHTFFPEANLTRRAGNYTIGVRLRSGTMDFQAAETSFNYTFQVFLGGCRFWDPVNEGWSSDGCEVGNLTTPNSTQCLCTHLTSFGGEMVVPPNTIDFKNVWAKFKNLNENAAVFSTVVALLGLYVIGLIWARHMDKKDIIKWGATPLEDNLPTDNYHYQLSVSTGMKKSAGTKSNISFIISGEEADTGVRRLFDGKRKSHEKGSIMNYILSVERMLGSLTFLRVWHDNSGTGKDRSWFLDQIEVTDLQTGERHFFLCNRWLACEEDDGMVDRILPAAGLEELVAFKQLFSSSVRKKLTSDHLWLSVFSRPTRSKFTRVQRISCCMSLLFLTMITNAMWFKSDSEGDTNQSQQVVSIKLGPFSFTLQQVFISLASTIIVFPPSFLLVTLFRRTKQKKNAVLQTNQRLPKRGKWKNLGNNNSHSALWEMEPKKNSRLGKLRASIQNLLKGHKAKYSANEEDEEFSSIPEPTIAGDPDAHKKKNKKKKKPFMFPHWCCYIAWILCFFSIIAPAFFTILYSMEWGATKANEWLVTFLLSFFQSVIVVQPIKVLCLVAFIACVLKKPDLEEEGDTSDALNNAIAAHDEEITIKGHEFIDEIARRRKEANDAFEPPDTEMLEQQRKARMKELEMEAILKEICVYGFFVLVLFFLSYQQRDRQSYVFTENMKALFLGNGKFESIKTVLDYWVWLEGTFLPTLYAAKYHNGTELFKWWDKRCLTDLSSRRMGIARMRQFRIKEDSCKILPVMEPAINHCRDDYNWYDDDTQAYMPQWFEPSEENRTILEAIEEINPWIYANSVKLKSAPYVATLQTYKGGGYVVNFERSFRRTAKNLTRLRSEDWLDLRTRAVFLEFTVYNPNANLYASAILVTEFPAHGAAMPRSEFKIFRLQSYVGGFAIVIILFEVLYCCFTLFFFYRCIKKVRKEKCKYFKTFWDILEFVMLCFGVACIVMYAFKHILTEVAISSLKNQSKAEYVNFQSLAMYDEYFGYMTAFVVFLASIQFLKLLQFNKKMHMLGDTVKLATKDLKVFSVAFMLYFLAFVIAFYLLFGKHMAGYNGFVQSAESTFAFTLGSFDFDAMSDAHKFLGPIFFFTFIMVIYVGLMSIFLTIIADAFATVKEDTADAQNDYEMADFVWRKFKSIIGVK